MHSGTVLMIEWRESLFEQCKWGETLLLLLTCVYSNEDTINAAVNKRMPTHALIHPLIHSLTHSLARSLTHSLTVSLSLLAHTKRNNKRNVAENNLGILSVNWSRRSVQIFASRNSPVRWLLHKTSGFVVVDSRVEIYCSFCLF